MTAPPDDIVSVLRAGGVADADIDAALADGLLPLLALERFVFLDSPEFTVDEVAAELGVDRDRLEAMWIALGFPRPRAAEPVFAPSDVELLSELGLIIDDRLADPEVLLNVARVLGASLSRVAEAQTDLVAKRGPLPDLDAGEILFGDVFVRLMERVWRRHLVTSARARLESPSGLTERLTAVGFADLVGFTSLSQQLDAGALAQVVARFEAVAFSIIGAHDGRVVKMIGDEVMFEVEDPVEAARCALALSASYHEADDLSDVRVGLAHGPVIERDGDLYGPTVNLAARITGIALPGSVVVDQAVHDALEHTDFELRSMLPRRLKHIGRVSLWVLRSADAGAHADEERRLRRDRRRARLIERSDGRD